MMKYLRRTILTFFLFVGIIVIPFYLLLNTTQGLSWILNSIKTFTANQFTYSQLSGKLTGTVSIGTITYQDKSISIKIQDATFKLDPSSWLKFRFIIPLVRAKQIDITQTLSESSNNAPMKFPKFPWFFDIYRLKIQQVTYKNNLSDNASFSLYSSIKNTSEGLSGTLSIPNFQGQYKQKPFNGNINIQFFPQGFSLQHSILHFANATIAIDGGFKKTWNALWSVSLTHADTMLDIGSNVLNLNGNISGNKDTPIIHLTKIKPISIPRLGITINSIGLTANIQHSGAINLTGQASSGSSVLNLKGQLTLISQGISATINLIGQNVLVMNTPTYKIYASSNVIIQRNNAGYAVSGRIDIPKANVNSPQLDGTESLSNDVQFYQPHQATKSTLFSGNINLVLGNNVLINLKGLSGQLIGAVTIYFNSASATTATGNLEIMNGLYSAYGQKLTVTKGKISYTGGSINNPGLELVGAKTIVAAPSTTNSTLRQNFSLPTSYSSAQSVKVGITVNGTLQHYTVSLFSDPAVYSQSDILALILTGKTADNISGNSAQLVLKAASSLKLGNNTVGNISQQLQQFFGLDQLGIGSQNYLLNGTTTQTTALTVGKHLTSRLSISYSIGLLNPISIFLANYSLTQNWSLQGNASTQDTGADIFYNIEK